MYRNVQKNICIPGFLECAMNAYPFSVFKRANRPFYFVSYKDSNGKFLSPVSTKKTTEKEAMQIAFTWLRDGVPKKSGAMKVHPGVPPCCQPKNPYFREILFLGCFVARI